MSHFCCHRDIGLTGMPSWPYLIKSNGRKSSQTSRRNDTRRKRESSVVSNWESPIFMLTFFSLNFCFKIFSGFSSWLRIWVPFGFIRDEIICTKEKHQYIPLFSLYWILFPNQLSHHFLRNTDLILGCLASSWGQWACISTLLLPSYCLRNQL